MGSEFVVRVMNGQSMNKEESRPVEINYQKERMAHWDRVADQFDSWRGLGGYYHQRLAQIYQFLIPPGHRVLEVGCGEGDLIAAVKPAYGVGIDFSPKMIERARLRHRDLQFVQGDTHELHLNEQFDFIIFSDVLNELWDVQRVFDQMRALVTPQTRIVINSYSRMWQLPLGMAKALRLARPTLAQNWLTVEDISNLLSLAGFEMIRSWSDIVLPLQVPFLSTLCNRYLVKFWPFKYFALTNLIVARPDEVHHASVEEPHVSVIVPARNESGNIAQVFTRTPQMGGGTELVFVEGHSQDDTYEEIERQITLHPEWKCKLFRQKGVGKGDAVRLGFENASGDILMILDADLTVPPEDLKRFYDVVRSGRGEFANGVRLVYPMEEQAMRFINLVGNKFFSLAFSWLLGQPIKDTLCGTKALWKIHYNLISENRPYFGDFDPFGDFDLLFGAAKLNLKIIEIPIRYRERTYGTTNIHRWQHGWLLLKMVLFASRRIKFT